MTIHPNHQQIIDAFTADPSRLIEWAADAIVSLGAKSEWDMEDNFATTETIASLPAEYGLPGAGDQSDHAIWFYGVAAERLGYHSDTRGVEFWPPEGQPGFSRDEGEDDWHPLCGRCGARMEHITGNSSANFECPHLHHGRSLALIYEDDWPGYDPEGREED